MAQVTMDMAELDKLRDSIKEKDSKLSELQTTLNDVKADKRVVVKTKYAPFSAFNNNYFTIDVPRMLTIARDFTSGNSFMPFHGHRIEELLKSCISLGRITPVDDSDLPVEYTNFDDVKAELAVKLEKDYSNELGELRQAKNTQNEKIAELIAENQDRVDALNKENANKLKVWTNAYDELTKKYQDLLEGREEQDKIQTLQKALVEANMKIEKLSNRNWFQRLLNY